MLVLYLILSIYLHCEVVYMALKMVLFGEDWGMAHLLLHGRCGPLGRRTNGPTDQAS
jgi:hypothetical protein